MDNAMKINVLLAAEGQKVLRKQEDRCKRKAKRPTTSNYYGTWAILREELYQQRMFNKSYLRYLNLARGFLKNHTYLTLEQGTREGNEPVPYEISNVLNLYGYTVSKGQVKEWIYANE